MKLKQLICYATILLFLGCTGIQKDTNSEDQDLFNRMIDNTMKELDQQAKTPNTANRVRTDVGWQFRGFVINHTCKHLEVIIHEIGDAHMTLKVFSRVLKPGPHSGYYDELEMPYTKEGVPMTRLHKKNIEAFQRKYEKVGMPWMATIWLYGDKEYLIEYKTTDKEKWQYQRWELDSKTAYMMDDPFILDFSCPDHKEGEKHECQH